MKTIALLGHDRCRAWRLAPALRAGHRAKLVVLTHDAFAISDAVLAKFESTYGVDVEILKGGDAGVMVNQAILTKDAPLADVLYGVDNTFLSRALDAGIFDAYTSSVATCLGRPERQHQRSGHAHRLRRRVRQHRQRRGRRGCPPATLQDLTDPEYRGKLVVENPATSSPGLAFLMATIGSFGEANNSWQSFWQSLRQNDVLVVDDWDTAYYTSFSGGAGEGDRPLVVSYATSPVAEVFFSDPPVTEAPTSVLADTCFLQIEYAGVLHGAKSPDGRASSSTSWCRLSSRPTSRSTCSSSRPIRQRSYPRYSLSTRPLQ